MPAPLTGLIPACHTPMDAQGGLALDRVDDQAALLREVGIRAVFIGGTTGECASLGLDERMALAERWCATAGGSMQVVVHVGDNSLPEAVKLAAHAREVGASAVSAVAPNYFKPATALDLVDFCVPIAAEADPLPFYYYDIPGMTGVRIAMSDFLRQARFRIPTLRGLKYSNDDLLELQECIRLEGGAFDVFFGSDECLLAGLCLGIRGAVGSTYNFAAPLYQRLTRAFEARDLIAARELQGRSIDLIKTLRKHGFLAASKAVMGMLGVDCGPVRAPLRSLSLDERVAIYEAIAPLDAFPRPLERPR
ncbi:N-acetylneuraminate lyase [Aquisphaera giovannonii]|uniref:N-acetylneuraminate lyase n=1 Tax=Aquisphaera giovannonii TaxID=406548 RepID=A0A5B9VZS6_9BACT|nr:dihydrodipicolinate synthase family protein [Aquisphaera giovannonii]QEH33872.1 N-acetylneuraminate lyase [Aquisphaera giovannonii]